MWKRGTARMFFWRFWVNKFWRHVFVLYMVYFCTCRNDLTICCCSHCMYIWLHSVCWLWHLLSYSNLNALLNWKIIGQNRQIQCSILKVLGTCMSCGVVYCFCLDVFKSRLTCYQSQQHLRWVSEIYTKLFHIVVRNFKKPTVKTGLLWINELWLL